MLKDFLIAKACVEILQSNGHKAFFVGGCVRDMLMGFTPKDFDIVTSCDIEGIVKLFPFPSHGKVTKQFLVHAFKLEGVVIEIASFRDEGTIENRDSLPKHGTMQTDVLRRDFTCNALFWDPIKDEIIDIVGGIDDINNKVLNTTRDPWVVFKEDPIRVLRAIRFQRTFGFEFGFKLNDQILESFLKLVDKSRLKNELLKIKKIKGAKK